VAKFGVPFERLTGFRSPSGSNTENPPAGAGILPIQEERQGYSSEKHPHTRVRESSPLPGIGQCDRSEGTHLTEKLIPIAVAIGMETDLMGCHDWRDQ
jgi:hypothetical protein